MLKQEEESSASYLMMVTVITIWDDQYDPHPIVTMMMIS